MVEQLKHTLSEWRIKVLIVLFISFLAVALLSPLRSDDYIASGVIDLKNHIVLTVQAKLGLDEGQFPLRVAPTEHRGLRYPIFQFYSPLFYMISGAMYKWIMPANPYAALKLTLIFALGLGGIYAYRTTLLISQNTNVSVIASTLYLCMPYFLITQFITGAYPEGCAIQAIPLILFYTLVILERNPISTRNTIMAAVLLSLSWTALTLLHSNTFLYTSFFMLPLITVYCILMRQFKPLFCILCAYLSSILSTLWFTVPIIAMKDFMYIAKLMVNPHTFVDLTPFSAIFSFTTVKPTPDHPAKTLYDVYASLGLPGILAIAAALYLLCSKINKPLRTGLSCLIMTLAVVFVLLCDPFNIYAALPTIFHAAQFTYRLLAQTQWITLLLFALVLSQFNNQSRLSTSQTLMILSLVILSCSPWLLRLNSEPRPVAYYQNNPVLIENNHAYVIQKGFIPVISPAQVLDEPSCMYKGYTLHCSLKDIEPGIALRLPLLYYPRLWEITLDGQSLAYFPLMNTEKYIVTAVTIPHSGMITAVFKGFVWANWVSALTMAALLLVLLLCAITRSR